MYLLLRCMIFLISGTVISIFTTYLKLAYFFDSQQAWIFSGIRNSSHYDYIVVGAGSAGSILASRLANGGDRVMLVEAGGKPPPFIDIPLLAPLLQSTVYDWQYITAPQTHACKGLKDHRSKWPMGKILGGTSRLNYMAYVRGHPNDYEDWLPNLMEPTMQKGGLLNITPMKWNTPFADIILESLLEMGQPITNINKGENTGFMKAELTMENGRRWSSDKMLFGKDNNDNLKLVTHAMVKKVLLESNRAVGIEFSTMGTEFQAFASKAIILSAGAIGSPKLLMLSGIGPKQHLENLKINTIVNLPVGNHLVDHILTGIDLITLNSSIGLNIMDALNPISAIDYFSYGEGPWTSSGVEVLGTFHSQNDSSLTPDLQLMVLPLGIAKDHGMLLRKAMGISDKVYNEYFASLENENTVTIAPVLLHPKSSGELRLRTNDPADEPLINPKYLSNYEDVVTLIKGLEFVRKLIETKSMKAVGASFYTKNFPGCEDKQFGTTEYWECYVRHLTLTSYHPAGTCRLGDVVDKSFKVYGTTNLYVVDASVFPRLPSGNIQAAVAMTAERAALVIKQQTKDYETNGSCYIPNCYKNLFNTYRCG